MNAGQYSAFRAWSVTIIGGLFFMLIYIQLSIPNTLVTYFSTRYHLYGFWLGLFNGIYLIGNISFQPIAGYLMDKYSVKRLMLITLIILHIGLIGLAFSTSATTAIFCRLLMGCTDCFAFISMVRLAISWIPPRRIALAIGILITEGMIGGLLAQKPMALVYQHYLNLYGLAAAGKYTLLWNVALGAVVILLVAIFIKDRPAHYRSPIPTASDHKTSFSHCFRSVLGKPQNWCLAGYAAMINLPIMLLGYAWGNEYLMQVYKLPHLQASSVMSMIFLGAIIGSPALGMIADKCSSRRFPMFICTVGAFVAITTLLTAPLSTLQLFPLVFALGFFSGGVSLAYPFAADINADHVVSTANAFIGFILMGLGALLQPLYGEILSRVGGTSVEGVYTKAGFSSAMMLLVVGLAISIFCVAILRPTQKRR